MLINVYLFHAVNYLLYSAKSNNVSIKLKYYDNKKYVICTDITNYKGGNNTHHEKIIESIKERGLVTNHAYSLIDVAEIKDKLGNDVQLLKVRNPWGN